MKKTIINSLRDSFFALLAEGIMTALGWYTKLITLEMVITIIIISVVFLTLLGWFRWSYETDKEKLRAEINTLKYRLERDLTTVPERDKPDNFEYRFQAFMTEAKAILEEVHGCKRALLKLNDRTHDDFKNHYQRLIELYSLMDELRNQIPDFTVGHSNIHDVYHYVRDSSAINDQKNPYDFWV